MIIAIKIWVRKSFEFHSAEGAKRGELIVLEITNVYESQTNLLPHLPKHSVVKSHKNILVDFLSQNDISF